MRKTTIINKLKEIDKNLYQVALPNEIRVRFEYDIGTAHYSKVELDPQNLEYLRNACSLLKQLIDELKEN